ncbi:MAG: uracil-xanthine permease family protein [Clostridium sp.]|nr:uracil-xanthine permease family protein [Clostridium sp.]
MLKLTEGISGNLKKKKVGGFIFKGVLGFQHLIAMFGATVLVPLLTGLDPAVALFSAGLGTLIFHLCTKGKVPVFLGSSFAFIPVIQVVAKQYGDLRYAQGGILVVGLIYVILSFVIKKIGVDKIRKVLSAQVVGPMIIVIGLNLIPDSLKNAGVNDLLTGQAGAIKNVIISAITLGLALSIKHYGKGMLKQVAILIAVIVGYGVAYAMGIVETKTIAEASLLAVPNFTLPKFDLSAILIIVPVVLAVFMEHIGDITTNGQVVGKNFIEEPGLNRTMLGDGLATFAAGLIGGPANTTYGENTGVLAITKNYDPSILRITAVFAILLSFIGKFREVIVTMPSPVMGGISLMLFSMIAIVGVQTIKREKVKMNIQNIIIIATILFIGLSGNILSNPIGILVTSNVSISGLSLAGIVGVILNKVMSLTYKIKK